MNWKLASIISKKAKIFAFFDKMIVDLEKTNKDLEVVCDKANAKLEQYQQYINTAKQHLIENETQIQKIKEFINRTESTTGGTTDGQGTQV